MSSLKILLPLLAISSPICCNSFAPQQMNHHISSRPTTMLQSTSGEDNNIETKSNKINPLDRVGAAAGSAFVALTLSFSSVNVPLTPIDNTIPSANALPSSSILLAKKQSKTVSEEDEALKELEEETLKDEREVKIDAKKARVEKSREAFYEYEAKMAEQQEERIETMEKKAELEAEQDKIEAEKDKAEAIKDKAEAAKDKAEAAKLMAEEKKLIAEEKSAKTKEEKAVKLKEAKVSKRAIFIARVWCVCVYIHIY